MTKPENPVVFVDTQSDFDNLCLSLMSEPVLGLDVETTLANDPDLCTIQFANASKNWIIDVLALDNIRAVEPVLLNKDIVKVIHYAAFEKKVFASYGYKIHNVFDTCTISRKLRRHVSGGHSLLAVCAREIFVELDKQWQTSDWTTRPLAEAQLHYAALDAEVLVKLFDIFSEEMPSFKKPDKERSGNLFAMSAADSQADDNANADAKSELRSTVKWCENTHSGSKRLSSGPSLPVSFSRGEVFAFIRRFFQSTEKANVEPLVQWLGDKVTVTPLKTIEAAVLRGFIRDARVYGIVRDDGHFIRGGNLRIEQYGNEQLRSLLIKLLDRACAVNAEDAPGLFLSELGVDDNPSEIDIIKGHIEFLLQEKKIFCFEDVLSLDDE